MKVALIAPPWLPVPPEGYGGTEAVIDRLARGLSQAGHDVILFTTGDSQCPVRKRWLLPRAMPHMLNNSIVELRHVMHAYDAVADCDIVHDHTITGMVHALAHPELQVVTTSHGPFGYDELDIFSRVASRVPIIAISECQAASAGGIPIAAVIHHGLDLDAFPIGEVADDYFLFLGRMSPTKGAREAIEIARAAGVDAPERGGTRNRRRRRHRVPVRGRRGDDQTDGGHRRPGPTRLPGRSRATVLHRAHGCRSCCPLHPGAGGHAVAACTQRPPRTNRPANFTATHSARSLGN